MSGQRLPQKGDLAEYRAKIFEAKHPLERVTAIQGSLQYLDKSLHQAVADARAEGCSWGQIAEALGLSRSAAFERFRDASDLDR